jgi:four helix bundle protein
VETTAFCAHGPTGTYGIVCDQLLRSASSAGAHVEEAEGGWTRAEFARRMTGGLSEARDWLRIRREARFVPADLVNPLIGLAGEFVALLTVIVRSSRSARAV